MLDDFPIEFILMGGLWLLFQICGSDRYKLWRGPGTSDAEDAQIDHNRQFGGPKP